MEKSMMGQDAGKSIMTNSANLLDKLKTPVFWFAVGYIAAVIIIKCKKVVTI